MSLSAYHNHSASCPFLTVKVQVEVPALFLWHIMRHNGKLSTAIILLVKIGDASVIQGAGSACCCPCLLVAETQRPWQVEMTGESHEYRAVLTVYLQVLGECCNIRGG